MCRKVLLRVLRSLFTRICGFGSIMALRSLCRRALHDLRTSGNLSSSVSAFLDRFKDAKKSTPGVHLCSPISRQPFRQGSFLPLQADQTSQNYQKIDPFSLVSEELAMLADRLRLMVCAEVPKLASAAEYFFKLGVEGKRFRPMVLLLMASSLSAGVPLSLSAGVPNFSPEEQRRRQQRIAEITEMIHVASLLHDDVLDHADTRRGISSLNFIMGNKLAVLAGDFLLARASVVLASLQNTEVVQLLSQVLEHLVTGEIMQWTTDSDQSCNMDYYLQKSFYKTASLMANSCKAVALLAGHPAEVANLAFDYGSNLGLAYQLVDDALDFTGTKASLGKPSLSDLKQGIATAPVLYALEEHPAMRPLITRKFKTNGDVDLALTLVRDSNGIKRTHDLAREHADRAASAVAAFPPCPSEKAQLCRKALMELTHQVVTRSK